MRCMKLAGIFGILLLIIAIISFIFSSISYFKTINMMQEMGEAFPLYSPGSSGITFTDVFTILIFIIAIVSILFLYFGFVKMGQYANSSLLKIASWLIILFGIITIILFIILIFQVQSIGSNIDGAMVDSQAAIDVNLNYLFTGNAVGDLGALSQFNSLLTLFYIFLGILILTIICIILFNIGLINIRNSVRFSMVAGILGLIFVLVTLSFVTYVAYLFASINSGNLILGIFRVFGFISFVYSIPGFVIYLLYNLLGWSMVTFMVLSLFDASKKFEGDVSENSNYQNEPLQDSQNSPEYNQNNYS